MPRLHGVGVLVTRPELQAASLCRRLEAEGAATWRLPALEIKPLKDRRAVSERLGALEAFDVVIFTSANAVRFGHWLLDQKRDLTLAAVGPATARALNQAGYRVALSPSDSFDTEGLLSHPKLERVAGNRILIIKGNDGRPLLQQELTRRGATVLTGEVYERTPARPTAEALAEVRASLAAGDIHVITATSVETVQALLQFADPELRAQFERAQWLVPSERVATGARELGLAGPLLLADSAEDQDLVEGLVRWRSRVSGA